jgi:hypothetical protein
MQWLDRQLLQQILIFVCLLQAIKPECYTRFDNGYTQPTSISRFESVAILISELSPTITESPTDVKST